MAYALYDMPLRMGAPRISAKRRCKASGGGLECKEERVGKGHLCKSKLFAPYEADGLLVP